MPGAQSLRSTEGVADGVALPLHRRRSTKTRNLCENREGCGTAKVTLVEKPCHLPRA